MSETTSQVGQRVELLNTTDEHTELKSGEKGTVPFGPDAMGTIHVQWDSGSTLGLVPGEDHWRVLSPDMDRADGLGTEQEGTQ